MSVNNIQFTKIEIQIAKYLFKHYKGRYNARQLARILNINHAHANKLCNSLVEKELLEKERLGNSIFFSYNYNNNRALRFMEYLLNLEAFPEWLTVVAHSLKKLNSHLKMGLVFGSSIKTKDFNDIDVLLIYDKKETNAIKKIKDEIRKSELIEKPIRYVEIAEEDIPHNRTDNVFYNIISESIVFHNPEKYVEIVKTCHK